MSSKLMTAQQVATEYGVKLWTVRKMAERGCPHILLGNKMLFTETGIEEWIAEEITRSAAKAGAESRGP